MKSRELVYCVLTVVILCAMLLLWGSRSLGGTGRAACLVAVGNWREVGAGSASGGGISDNNGDSWSPSLGRRAGWRTLRRLGRRQWRGR